MGKSATLMLVSVTDEHDGFDSGWTLRFTAEPAGFDENGTLYSAGWYGISVPRDLDDFQVCAWRSSRYAGDALIARAEFRQVYSVDEARAEAMLKVLRKVNRKVAQLSEKYGAAQDAGQYCA
jgi:hypothetical protein